MEIRIADVPKPVRLAAARRVMRDETDPYERLKILMVAEFPGDLIAYLRP